MTETDDFQGLPLTVIMQRCRQESLLYFDYQAHDPRFCFELFRRAILEENEMAWNFVCNQYYSLVANWVKGHRLFPASREEADYFINGAYSKLWMAISPQKFTSFNNLKSLLGYLKLCVSSVITDHMRDLQKRDKNIPLEEMVRQVPAKGEYIEKKVERRVLRDQLWDIIQSRLKDENERIVVYESFVYGLKPGDIFKRHKREFRHVREIYRLKENILARLGRDADLRRWFDSNA